MMSLLTNEYSENRDRPREYLRDERIAMTRGNPNATALHAPTSSIQANVHLRQNFTRRYQRSGTSVVVDRTETVNGHGLLPLS